MKRMLMLASVASMIDQFNMPNIELLQEMGYAVDVACNFKEGNTCSNAKVLELRRRLDQMNVRCFQIDFARDVTVLAKNMRALWQVEYLLRRNEYEFLHCHSPIGGVVGRVAGKLTGTKVIYTAHGFHFYKGAPLKNWLVYYPIEKICAHCTDVLITINKEDYQLAERKMRAKKVEFIPGVGVDLDKYNCATVDCVRVRRELGIPEGMTWILAVGELIPRKNHETLIKAVAQVDSIYLTIAGQGVLQEKLSELISSLGVENRVKLLGFRSDVSDLCAGADVFAFPSFQEGLSLALMEAMSSGKAIVCSRIRGNTDLVDEKGGILFDPSSVEETTKALKGILEAQRKEMGEYNARKVQRYGLCEVLKRERKIYQEIA